MEQRLVDINKVKEVTLEDSVSFISYTPDNGVDCYINADTVFTLPENHTNGDMIKAVFPKYYQTVLGYLDNTSWWNAPYGERGELKEDK
jgi:hypothetical protein